MNQSTLIRCEQVFDDNQQPVMNNNTPKDHALADYMRIIEAKLINEFIRVSNKSQRKLNLNQHGVYEMVETKHALRLIHHCVQFFFLNCKKT
jgi:hypothetical protein